MNLVTTIPIREDKGWVTALFKKGPHNEIILERGGRSKDVPAYPPTFPFSRKVARGQEIKFLYLVNRGHLLGYGEVAECRPCDVVPVGINAEGVGPGDEFVLRGRMQYIHKHDPVSCMGFRNFRYIEENLHKLTRKEILKVVRRLKLMP